MIDLDRAIELESTYVDAYNNKAWMLATAPDAAAREGAEAVKAATKAFELTGEKSPVIMDTLAAACAEAGDFDRAVQLEEKALADPDLVKLVGEAEVKAARDRLALYRDKKPFHEKPRAAMP